MIRRNTWIVLLVFAVLFGIAVYLNRNPLPSASQATPSATEIPMLLSGWSDSDIVWIEYKGDPAPVTLAQNPDGSWTVGPENSAAASIGQVEYLRTQIAALRANSVLNTTDPLDAVGLAAPTRVITLRNSAGQTVNLRIGKETPTGSAYYVQVDNQTPVVLSKFSVDAVLEALNREILAAPTATPPVSPTASETVVPAATPQATATP